MLPWALEWALVILFLMAPVGVAMLFALGLCFLFSPGTSQEDDDDTEQPIMRYDE